MEARTERQETPAWEAGVGRKRTGRWEGSGKREGTGGREWKEGGQPNEERRSGCSASISGEEQQQKRRSCDALYDEVVSDVEAGGLELCSPSCSVNSQLLSIKIQGLDANSLELLPILL